MFSAGQSLASGREARLSKKNYPKSGTGGTLTVLIIVVLQETNTFQCTVAHAGFSEQLVSASCLIISDGQQKFFFAGALNDRFNIARKNKWPMTMVSPQVIFVVLEDDIH